MPFAPRKSIPTSDFRTLSSVIHTRFGIIDFIEAGCYGNPYGIRKYC
jgi:hypothetical protein